MATVATANRLRDNQALLRRALRANAAFSTLSGATFALASGPIASAIGLDYPVIILAIGVGLLIFAAGVFRNAARAEINRLETVVTIVGDFGWVLASGAIILLGYLNTTGNWAVAAIADVVLLFAILQWVGLRKALHG